MAAPRDIVEVFRLIEEEEDKLGAWGSAAGDALVKKEFRKYSHLPFMRNVTTRDYYLWGFEVCFIRTLAALFK